MKLALFSAWILMASVPLTAAVITVSPSSQTAALGSNVQVGISISGVVANAAPSVGAFDLNIAYNSAILSFAGVTFGDPLQGDQLDLSGAGSIADFNLPAPGALEIYEVSLDDSSLLNDSQAGQFVVATIQFKTVSVGSSAILPTVNSLADATGSTLAATVQKGQVGVSAVPEPSLCWVLPAVAIAFYFRTARKPARLS